MTLDRFTYDWWNEKPERGEDDPDAGDRQRDAELERAANEKENTQ